jgi:hypothetical protein
VFIEIMAVLLNCDAKVFQRYEFIGNIEIVRDLGREHRAIVRDRGSVQLGLGRAHGKRVLPGVLGSDDRCVMSFYACR